MGSYVWKWVGSQYKVENMWSDVLHCALCSLKGEGYLILADGPWTYLADFQVKVTWTFQYVPSDYLSPFLADSFSEDSCCELKCRENRRLLVTAAFKTLQKSHFSGDTLTLSRISTHISMWKFLKLTSQTLMKEFLIFLTCFQIGRSADKKLTESGEEGGRIHFLQSLICFLTKAGSFQNKLRFLLQRNDFDPVAAIYHEEDEDCAHNICPRQWFYNFDESVCLSSSPVRYAKF